MSKESILFLSLFSPSRKCKKTYSEESLSEKESYDSQLTREEEGREEEGEKKKGEKATSWREERKKGRKRRLHFFSLSFHSRIFSNHETFCFPMRQVKKRLSERIQFLVKCSMYQVCIDHCSNGSNHPGTKE